MKEYILYVFTEQINYLAILVAAIANFAVGAIWYSPLLFSKKWAAIVFKGQSFEEATAGANMVKIFSLTFLVGLVQATGLGFLMWDPGFKLQHGMAMGFFIAVIFLASNLFKNSLFERRPFRYVMINGGHDTICFIVMGAIIAAWR